MPVERTLLTLALLALGAVMIWLVQSRLKRRASRLAQHDHLLAPYLGQAAIVYFYSAACVPCRTLQGPALDRLARELGDRIQIVRVDAEADPEAAMRWGVLTAPTTFVIGADGRTRAVNHGYTSETVLKRQLDSALVHAA
jgi:thioredoxin 1